jgi:hypothetical protein
VLVDRLEFNRRLRTLESAGPREGDDSG